MNTRGMHKEVPLARGNARSLPPGVTISGWERKPDVFGRYDDSEDSDDGNEKSAVVKTAPAAPTKLATIVRTAPVEIDPKGLYCVMVDGYYRKSKSNGGYGAILRCNNGQPVAAVAGASLHSVSGFYHTLEGVRAGILLAIENNVNYIHIVCNADWIYWIVKQCFQSNCAGHCRTHREGTPVHDFDMFCVTCFKQTKAKHDFTHNLEIMKEIVGLGKRYFRNSFITSVERRYNEPADFLAKMVRSPGEQRMLKPHEFPDTLEAHLSEFGGNVPFNLA